MNKKIIYAFSIIAMLVVAVSIGLIFSKAIPPMVNVTSEDTKLPPQANQPNSVTQTLEPIEDLITHSAQGKPMLENNAEITENSDSSSIFDNLIFSTKNKKTESTKESNQAEITPTAKVETEKTKITETPMPKKEIVQKTPPQKKAVLLTKSSLAPKEGVSTIINAELNMDGDQVKLLVTGDNKIEAKTFILEQPNRVVFDIKGTWVISIPRLISNRMVQDIRLGKTDTHTRLVFDLKVKPSNTQLKQISPTKVQLIFK